MPEANESNQVDKSNDGPVLFVLINQCIRNDHHCPECRRYFVSFHRSWNSAFEKAKYYINEKNEDEDDSDNPLLELRANSTVWIDQWVRRRNGDDYRICPIGDGLKWNLAERPQAGKEPFTNHAEFMKFELHLDRTRGCPDNLRFFVLFSKEWPKMDQSQDQDDHSDETNEDSFSGCDGLTRYINSLTNKTESTCQNNQLNQIEVPELRDQTFEVQWTESLSKDGSGIFTQVFRLQDHVDSIIKLHDLCPYSQSSKWFKR